MDSRSVRSIVFIAQHTWSVEERVGHIYGSRRVRAAETAVPSCDSAVTLDCDWQGPLSDVALQMHFLVS